MTMATLRAVPEMLVGADALASLGEAVRSLTGARRRTGLIVDAALKDAHAPAVERSLAAAGGAVVVTETVAGEPKAERIAAMVAAARRGAVNAVVGLGGGSALDAAKMVAALAPEGGDPDDYALAAKPLPGKRVPLIAVPTTAGTGSEATWTAVHTSRAGRKVWCWGPELAAARVILDPKLTVALPPALTAATGLDALVHAIEAATNANHSFANDALCLAAVRLVTENLPRAVAKPDDLNAREAMLVASCFAGQGINNAGTAIAHTIAHAMGSLGPVHHGRAAAIGLKAALPWNISVNGEAFAAVAEAMGGPREARALPRLFDQLLGKVGLDLNVARDLPGVGAKELAREMARPEHAAMRRSNAKPSNEDDLQHLAERVLSP